MAESRIQSLPEEDALHQIVETIQQAEAGAAPFALVLGSGFSHGLVPTARQLVEESLPLWVKSLNEGEPFEPLIKESPDQRNQMAREFWKQFVAKNSKREGFDLQLNSNTGFADDYSAAYRAAFDPNYTGAVGEPAQARKFQRALMRLDQPRLNAAHFLLASLLGVQPGKSRENDLFQARAAFSRLILTTNFDPFLQTALQAVNRLYFMSDTPELGVTDEILDDQTDAIHLVYLHGSIHRRSQAATDNDIKAIKERNARTLAPVLKRHGVIVLGYSGWDDAIVEALAACDRFDHRLYWCGRESDPLSKGAFGPRVVDILRKPAALYVKIDSAGQFMAQLCTRLVKGIPRLLDNPIGQLREMLVTIDLKELEPMAPPVILGSPRVQPLNSRSNQEALVKAQRLTIERLTQAELLFISLVQTHTPVMEEALKQDQQGEPSILAQPEETKSRVRQLLSSADLAEALGNYEESLNLCTKAFTLSGLDAAEQAELFMTRARAYYYLGKKEEAISDWTKTIELPELPVEWVALALVNRGVGWGEQGKADQELDDYTRVIEQLPTAPVELVAQALVNRGVGWGEQGKADQALADYTRVIEQLPTASIEIVARALVNRGVDWGKQGKTDQELADYTRVIEQLPTAPVDLVAQALVNRGVGWGEQGKADQALADYTRVIEQLPTAPVELVAQALANRGVVWGKQGKTDQALADYTRVIEQLPAAPVELVAQALVKRGVVWGEQGETDQALDDYTRVIEQLPTAPVDLVAQALVNRGVVWEEQGKTDQALADCTRVIELPTAPVERVATALNNRGWVHYQRKAYPDFLADVEAALTKSIPLDFASFNWGLALLANNRDAEALIAYKKASEQFPKSIETHGLRDLTEARRSWLSDSRAEPIIQLLRSLKM